MYYININTETGRCLSMFRLEAGRCCLPTVDHIPEHQICDYIYTDGKLVYDPLPAPVPVSDDNGMGDLMGMSIDHELRITLLELGV